MIQLQNAATQTVAENGYVVFSSGSRLAPGMYFRGGEGTVLITRPGVYLVQFCLNASDVEDDSTTETLSFALTVSGEPLGGATASASIASDDEVVNLGASTAVLVPFGGSVSVGIQNVGTISTTVTNAGLTIIQTAGR